MYLGIDLAAKEENPSGICILNDSIETYTVNTDKQILELTDGAEVVAIDAPLTESSEAFRDAERELIEEGLGPILPLNTPGMERLIERAEGIKNKIDLDVKIIETYPRAVEKALELREQDKDERYQNEHEYDAYLCALAARSFHLDDHRVFGRDEERIMIPKSKKTRSDR